MGIFIVVFISKNNDFIRKFVFGFYIRNKCFNCVYYFVFFIDYMFYVWWVGINSDLFDFIF